MGGAGEQQNKYIMNKLIYKLINNMASILPVASFHFNVNKNFVHESNFVAKLDSGVTKHFLTEKNGKN